MNNEEVTGAERLLSPLKRYLSDPDISEILVNKTEEVWIEKRGQLSCHAIPEFTAKHLESLFRLIANASNQSLSAREPLLSGSLYDGSRVQLVMPPTAKNYTMSIRRKVVKNYSLEDYLATEYYSRTRHARIDEESLDDLSEVDQALVQLYKAGEWDEFIRQAVKAKKNIVVSGGTSAGKTTYLNACLREIPFDDRIIILEDTREVDIPHPNQVQLLASKGQQGIAKIDMQQLVQCCLRLRPDRIIMGEIRGAEIMDFVAACSTGHEGSITSVHANNPKIAFMRMSQMYKLNNVPSMSNEDILDELKAVIDIIIQVAKTSEGRKAQSIYFKYGHLSSVGFSK